MYSIFFWSHINFGVKNSKSITQNAKSIFYSVARCTETTIKNSFIMSSGTIKLLQYVLCTVNSSSATKTKFSSPSVGPVASSLNWTYLLSVYHKAECFMTPPSEFLPLQRTLTQTKSHSAFDNCEQNNTTVILVVINIRSTSGGFHCSNVLPIFMRLYNCENSTCFRSL
jgi:hypothetical protein